MNRTLYLWSNSLSPGCGIHDYPEGRSNVAHLLDSLLLMKRKPKLKLMITQKKKSFENDQHENTFSHFHDATYTPPT
jgi:hypothetical protein